MFALKGSAERAEMKNLFAYGTLMCEDIMREVSGVRLVWVPGKLKGYSRRQVQGEHYPGLVPNAEGLVEGVVYREVPDAAWQRLDRFEGAMYARRDVQVELPDGMTLLAEAYVVRPEYRHQLDASDWDPDRFLRHGKASFQRHYPGYHTLGPDE